MTLSLSRRLFLAATTSLVAVRPGFAMNSFDVQMVNKHPENPKIRQAFFPRIQVVKPGDTVNFLATDRGHNAAVIDGMIPDDVEAFEGKINEEISVTFDKPGFYGYMCTPHASVGMVGLIIVEGEGMMDNLEAAKGVRQRGKAKAAWAEIWEEVDAMEFAMA